METVDYKTYADMDARRIKAEQELEAAKKWTKNLCGACKMCKYNQDCKKERDKWLKGR